MQMLRTGALWVRLAPHNRCMVSAMATLCNLLPRELPPVTGRLPIIMRVIVPFPPFAGAPSLYGRYT